MLAYQEFWPAASGKLQQPTVHGRPGSAGELRGRGGGAGVGRLGWGERPKAATALSVNLTSFAVQSKTTVSPCRVLLVERSEKVAASTRKLSVPKKMAGMRWIHARARARPRPRRRRSSPTPEWLAMRGHDGADRVQHGRQVDLVLAHSQHGLSLFDVAHAAAALTQGPRAPSPSGW